MAKTIILLHKNRRERELLILDWEKNYEGQFIGVDSEVKAIQAIENFAKKNHLVLIVEDNKDCINWDEFLASYLKSHPEVLTLICSFNALTTSFNHFEDLDLFDHQRVDQQFLSLGIEKNNEEDNDFCRIRPYQFMQYSFSICDVFLKLSSKKFVKIMNSGEVFTKEIIQHYNNKGLGHFYIKKEDYEKYLEDISKTLDEYLEKDISGAGLQREIQLAAMENIHRKLMHLGVSESFLESAQKTADSVLRSMNKNEKLWAIFLKHINNSQFVFEHSLICAYLSCAVAKEIEWESEFIRRKLVMASLLHDITLQDEKSVSIRDSEDDIYLSLTLEEQKRFLKHPSECAEIVKNLPNIPTNVETIIHEHHERPDGSGFPRKLNANTITPLSCIFIIAEDFIHRVGLLDRSDDFKKKRDGVLQDMGAIYSKGNFKSPFNGLVNLFI